MWEGPLGGRSSWRVPSRRMDAEATSVLRVTAESIDVEAIRRWAVRPECGATVVFCGTTRDHAFGIDDVVALEYEAYEEQVVPRLAAIEAEVRARHPDVVAVAAVHRVGRVALGETAVVVAVSSPHRAAAFDAAATMIDRLKASVPIWKEELSADGRRFSPATHPLSPRNSS